MKVLLLVVVIVAIAAVVAGGAVVFRVGDKLNDANECSQSQWVDDAATTC
jgi:hypothetical protein